MKAKVSAVFEEVATFNREGRHIWRSNQLTQLVNSKTDYNVSDVFVSSILRKCCGFKYKRVKRHAFQGNSEPNIVKRAMYANVMLNLLV